VKKILDKDASYAPFNLLGIEEDHVHTMQLTSGEMVRLGGSIDRVDEKEGKVRILDLKTGKDSLEFSGLEKVFQRGKREKVVLQTFFYSLLYPDDTLHLVPSVYNKNVLFQDESWTLWDKVQNSAVLDFNRYREGYVEQLRTVLDEIFDPLNVFDQVDDVKMCQNCDYNVICQRS
jgi:ATP-dependent helicase/DNAse subunit B